MSTYIYGHMNVRIHTPYAHASICLTPSRTTLNKSSLPPPPTVYSQSPPVSCHVPSALTSSYIWPCSLSACSSAARKRLQLTPPSTSVCLSFADSHSSAVTPLVQCFLSLVVVSATTSCSDTTVCGLPPHLPLPHHRDIMSSTQCLALLALFLLILVIRL